MKLHYTTRDGRLTVELEGSTQQALWKELAQFQEVFEDTTCVNSKGVKSDKVKFVHRVVDDNDFFELQCVDEDKPELRFAKKKFGQHKGKGGTLFPKGGWVKWDREKKEEVEL